MKDISLFSGMGGDSLGMVNAELDLVAYSEKENVFRETHDMIFSGFPCFVKGTQVLTDSGYKNIEKVKLYMKLVTHKGRLQDIMNLQQKLYTGTMYTVLYEGRKAIVCTEEQPFYVRTYNGDYTFQEPVWKAVKDLGMNDYCGMVTNTNISMIVDSYTKVKTTSIGKGLCLSEKCIIASVDTNMNETEYYTENEYTWEAPISFNTHQVVDEQVYNFEVKEDNSYIVENTNVHNCL
jgi:hypothetical protein